MSTLWLIAIIRAREQILASSRLNGRLKQARKHSSAPQPLSASSLQQNFHSNGTSELAPVDRSIEAVNPHVDMNAVATEKTFSTLATKEQDTIIGLLNLGSVGSDVGNAQKLDRQDVLARNVQTILITLLVSIDVPCSLTLHC